MTAPSRDAAWQNAVRGLIPAGNGAYDCPNCGWNGAITPAENGTTWVYRAACMCGPDAIDAKHGCTAAMRSWPAPKPLPNPAGLRSLPRLEHEDGWPVPVDFGMTVPPFPIDVFPPTWRRAAAAIATTSQTPVDLAATMILAVVAGCAQKKASGFFGGDHREPASLYMLTPMEPGNRKTFVFQTVTRPLVEHEAGLIADAQYRLATSKAMRDLKEADLKAVKEKAAKVGPTSTLTGSPSLISDRIRYEEEIERLARELADMDADAEAPTLVMDDTTPETLVTKMAKNGGRMMILSDEGEIFEIMAGRYAKSGAPNLGIFLKGHAGGDHRVDRQGRTEIIRRAALTMGISPQPDVMRGLMSKPHFHGRGVLARIVYCVPVSMLGERDHHPEPIPPGVAEDYRVAVMRLLHMPGQRHEDPETGAVSETTREYRAAIEAIRLLDAYKERLEPDLAEQARYGHIQGWAAKAAGLAGRLSLALQLMHNADPELRPTPDGDNPLKMFPHGAWIDGTFMEQAITLIDYFTEHALCAYDEMGVNEEVDDARILLNMIEEWGVDTFSSYEMFRKAKLRTRFKKAAPLKDALAILVERGWLRSEDDEPTEGKQRTKPKGPRYHVNPALTDRKAKRIALRRARVAQSQAGLTEAETDGVDRAPGAPGFVAGDDD